MSTFGDIVGQIISTLRLTDPDLDTSPGTPTRKIIDAVSESISEAYVDQYMLAYTYDIDSKIDGDLDVFVRLFGISRFAPRRATGTVTFIRNAVTADLVVPYGTILSTSSGVPVTFTTMAPAMMGISVESVTVPVQALEGGTRGNVAPGTINVASNLPLGVSVTNIQSTTGGTDMESDPELRLRWKRTVFRSLAGTEQMYAGIAIDDVDVSSVNVVTGSKRRFEQLQVDNGFAESQVQDHKYVYDSGVVVGPDISAGQFYLKDHDYSWDTSGAQPQVVVLNPAVIGDGSMIEIEFNYCPIASRNDPANNIMHRVDVWCHGSRIASATQSVVFTASKKFDEITGSAYNRFDWVGPDMTPPQNDAVFIPLAFGPILELPLVISAGGHTYGQIDSGDDTVDFPDTFRFVHRNTADGWGATSLFGIEWRPSTDPIDPLPPSNSTFTIGASDDYTYNEIPRSVQARIDQARLLGVDVMVHQAKQVWLRFNLAIIYSYGVNQTAVDANIHSALSNHLRSLAFNAVVQYSDILDIVHDVPGVDSVRFLHGADYLTWTGDPNNHGVAIQRIVNETVDYTYCDANGRALDVLLGDDEVPVLESVYISPRAQNTMGVG